MSTKRLPKQLESDLVFVICRAKSEMEGNPAYGAQDWKRIVRLQKLVDPKWINTGGQRP